MFKVFRELKVFLVRKVIRVMMEVRLLFKVLSQQLPIYQQKETPLVMDISRLIRVVYMFGMVVSGMMLVTLLDLKVYKDYKV